jgi:hypothetical protein
LLAMMEAFDSCSFHDGNHLAALRAHTYTHAHTKPLAVNNSVTNDALIFSENIT